MDNGDIGSPMPPAHDPYGSYPPMDQGGMPPYPGFQDQPQQQFSPEQMGFERLQPSYSTQQPKSQSVNEISILKDLELISVKLDAIKSELDSVNQRLKRIERLAEEPGSSPQPRKDAWSY